MKRRILTTLLSVASAFCLAAGLSSCGGTETSSEDPTSPTPTSSSYDSTADDSSQLITDPDTSSSDDSSDGSHRVDDSSHEEEPAHIHSMTYVDPVAPTCTEDGSYGYWYCEGCGLYFADEQGDDQLHYADTIDRATGHVWDKENVTWTWSHDDSLADLTFTCETDPSHTETVIATVTEEVTTSPTCEGEGVRTYTAVAEFEGKTYTDVSTLAISPIGHDWDYENPVWEWSEDHSTATLTISCLNDPDHKAVEEAQITSEVTVEPACETTGETTYTATASYNGYDYTDVKTATIDATGHLNLTEVAAVDPSCTDEGVDAHYHCEDCGKYYSDAEAAPESEITEADTVASHVDHTYGEDGRCSQCGSTEGLTYTYNASYGGYVVSMPSATTEEATEETVETTETEASAAEVTQVYIAEYYNDGENGKQPVTAIADSAFQDNTSITFVNIPTTVTRIGLNAFYGCTSLASVVIPSSVTTLLDSAFRDCTSLTSLTIPGSIATINDNAFYGCTSLERAVLGYGVTRVGYQAFRNCSKLLSIEIPDSVASFGSSAFMNCQVLTSFYIPDGVTSITAWMFYYCFKLADLRIPDSLTTIGQQAFENCWALTTIDIPNGFKSFASSAFSGCSGLTYVNYAGTASEWAGITFNNNPLSRANANLYLNGVLAEEITLEGITSVNANAFSGATSLTSVTIGSDVTSIGTYAFNGCTGLTSVTFENTTGWSVTGTNAETSETETVDVTVTETADNVTALTSTYVSYSWARADEAVTDPVEGETTTE